MLRNNTLDCTNLGLSSKDLVKLIAKLDVYQRERISELWLNNNKLTTLPNIGELFPNLTYLSLSNNRISSIPLDLQKLQHLKFLYMTENPLHPRILQYSGSSTHAVVQQCLRLLPIQFPEYFYYSPVFLNHE
jgi:hypothetical protein